MKSMVSCDILVVGAGPAGGATALAAASRGMRVLIVDRRQVVGVPVQCAEYIPAMLMGHLDLDKSFIVQQIRGMRTYLPDEPVTKTRAPGFTIDRELFDQALIQAASDVGAETDALHAGSFNESMMKPYCSNEKTDSIFPFAPK